ncbi:MAG TPA: hypothetical protein VGL72_28950 [Bryobacteraceae bacterium]
MSHRSALLVIAVLAVLAYLPAFQLSFIADDFPQIQMSRTVENPGGLAVLMASPIAQTRITFFVLTDVVDRLAGLNPKFYHGVAVGVHVLCCWLVYALGIWKLIGRKVSIIAACFFAVFEGHQEAVMWYSAIMETLLFLFGVGAMLCLIQWLRGKGWIYYGLALVSFGLALLSKESGYIYAALMALPVIEMSTGEKHAGRRRSLLGLMPFVVIGVAYVVWIALGRVSNPRFLDGSFAVSWHFPRVLAESFGRLLFVWGLLALAALGIFRALTYVRLVVYSVVWMLIGLIPYSFLTYLNRVPSRHTYLPSVGLALLVGAAMVCVWERLGGRLVLAIGAVILMVNVTILWRKKAEQYQTRALPTDMLINAVRRADGPIHIRCYPYIPLVAESAAREFGGMVVFEEDPKQKNEGRCLNFWYKDTLGNVREVFVPPARLP